MTWAQKSCRLNMEKHNIRSSDGRNFGMSRTVGEVKASNTSSQSAHTHWLGGTTLVYQIGRGRMVLPGAVFALVLELNNRTYMHRLRV